MYTIKTNYLPLIIPLLLVAISFMSCDKEEDESDETCTSHCTVIRGKILTSGELPLTGIETDVRYEKYVGIHYHLSRRKATAQSDKNGQYEMRFYLKDDEIQEDNSFNSFFEINVYLEKLAPEKYILPQDLTIVPDIEPLISGTLELKRDTAYELNLYVPRKKQVNVILQGFKPQQEGDRFEVRTLFPWGGETETDKEKILATKYEIANSGFGRFVATGEYHLFTDIPFPLNDSVVVSIIKVKNGIAFPENHKMYISADSPATLTYEY